MPLTREKIVNGFLHLRKVVQATRQNRNSVVVYPDKNVNMTSDSMILAGYGCGKTPSGRSLEALILDAKKNDYGFSVIPKYGKHDSILAVKASIVANIANSPLIWLDALLSESKEIYLKAARGKYDTLYDVIVSELEESEVNTPEAVVLELTNKCNLNCIFCPRRYRKIKESMISIEEAKSIISELGSFSAEFVLYPYYLGEMLMHPHILEILKHACSYSNITVNFVSNGLLLDKEMQDEFVNLKIGIFHFSIHESNTALRNEKFLHPSKAKATRKVLEFIKSSMDQGKSPVVAVSMLPMTLDDPRVDEFKDYWLNIVSSVTIYSYVDPNRTIVDKSIKNGFKGKRLPCLSPWIQPVIAVDGSVLPCCWDYNHSMVMGNIFKQRFKDIWKGELFTKLRAKILEDDLSEYPVCHSCDKWITYLPPLKTVEMEKYFFFSNGANLAYMSKNIDKKLINRRLQETVFGGSSYE